MHDGALKQLMVDLGGHGEGVIVKDNVGRLKAVQQITRTGVEVAERQRILFGTSGWSYADWRGVFYPRGEAAAGFSNFRLRRSTLTRLK